MKKYLIAQNGESSYHITAHQYADETIRFAASELQKYLLRSTNAAIPYFSDRCAQRGPEIRIGAGVRGETYAETELHPDGFRIKGDGENINITGATSRGVLYGVYCFLERFCGFYCLTKDVEIIEKRETLEIELDEICFEPTFEFRDAYFRFAFDGGFASKNHLNSSLCDISVARGGRMKWFNFHHSFNDLVPRSEYFAEHPEYYSEINGERVEASQLCLTNPEVFEIAKATLIRWIRENPECRVFSVAQNDNRRRCTCERCMALEAEEGSPAGPIIHFVNKLADAIKDDYPDILIHTFAYQYSLPAPKHVVARDNVIVRLCSISSRFDAPFEKLALEQGSRAEEFVNAMRNWKDHASRLYVWDYTVNFSNYLVPFLHLYTLKENINFFRRMGVKGVLEQGNFAHGGGAAFDDLKSYVISRLLWNPDVDIDEEVMRFSKAVYGDAAGEKMAEYAFLTIRACESAPLTIRNTPFDAYLTDGYISSADRLVKEAIALADSEEHRKRVKREQLAIRFLQLVRVPEDAPNRLDMINEFFDDVKGFGITEIKERRSIAASKQSMIEGWTNPASLNYSLYYIMQ